MDNQEIRDRLADLAMGAYKAYRTTGSQEKIDEALELARASVDGEDADSPWRNNLGIMLSERYQRTGDMANLEEAIVVARLVMESTSADHDEWLDRLNNLGSKLESRYERLGEMNDLEEAIMLSRKAVEMTLAHDPDRGGRLNALGNMLERRYSGTGEVDDLHEAIILARQTVKLTAADDAEYASHWNNLATKLERLYDRTGETASLEEAIGAARQAVQSIPVGHADRSAWLSNLSAFLRCRYEQSGRMDDLEESIGVGRQALESSPVNHPDRAGLLSNLGNKLHIRFERTDEMANLEESIDLSRQALKLTQSDHFDLASRLSNVGNALLTRHEQTGDMGDLEESITLARQAVELLPTNHPDRLACLSNLGNHLRQRFERTGEMTDLEEAIQATRQAVESTAVDQPGRAAWLSNLGDKLRRRYELTDRRNDLDEAVEHLQAAWRCITAIPFHRVRAATECLRLLTEQFKIDAAIELGRAVIDFLPAVNARFLDWKDQQFVVSTFAGVSADVCALLLAADRPTDALEYLELGRAVIIGQLVDSRSDLSSLKPEHSAIARQYEELRDELNKPVPFGAQDARRVREMQRRREVAAELEACIRKIRTTEGNERFLLGQTVVEMQQSAIEGTIVVVNVTRLRSDAIIVSQASIQAISLPRLLASDAETWLSEQWTGRQVRREDRPRNNRKYLDYLIWLWDVCVEPILDEVRIADGATNELPRIWWIGTGLGNSMPFHAAGKHFPGSTENAMSRAISSYTPSIKALGYAQHRARARITDKAKGSLIIATMLTTPAQTCPTTTGNMATLNGVREEKQRITEIAAGHMPVVSLNQPSVGQVVGRLRDCSIAHFACHGATDHRDPSNSRLILQKRAGSKLQQDGLTVHLVSELRLANAHIAYLSACSTAENKAARLADEVIHVVSGFQVAGFPHVVGCLWPSIDRICVEVASEFYRSLFRQRRTGWDGREVALALQEAVMAVRAADMEMPLAWAQFVHFGA